MSNSSKSLGFFLRRVVNNQNVENHKEKDTNIITINHNEIGIEFCWLPIYIGMLQIIITFVKYIIIRNRNKTVMMAI